MVEPLVGLFTLSLGCSLARPPACLPAACLYNLAYLVVSKRGVRGAAAVRGSTVITAADDDAAE